MTQATQTLEQCCDLNDIRRGDDWLEVNDDMHQFTSTVIATMGRECREKAAVANNSEISAIIDENTRRGDPVIFTDGSVRRGVQSGWAFSARQDGSVVVEESGAIDMTTSSMTMEITAITKALEWTSKITATHVLIATDSMSTLQKIKGGRLYADWVPLILESSLKKITWVFCPGHAGISGNERADELAGDAVINGSITLDPAQVVCLVKEKLAATSVEGTSLTLATLKERGIVRGAGQQNDLSGVAR